MNPPFNNQSFKTAEDNKRDHKVGEAQKLVRKRK